MRPRAFILVCLFSLLFTAALSAKDKPNTKSHKMPQDFSKFVEIPGAERAGADQCVACHADVSKSYRRSDHSMRDVACEQCHGAASLHVAAGGYSSASKDKIISFRDRSPEEANEFCTFENLTAPNGKLPINTSGGNLAECYMHGLELITEAVRQVRGTSTAQVPDVKLSLVAGGPVAAPVSSLILRP